MPDRRGINIIKFYLVICADLRYLGLLFTLLRAAFTSPSYIQYLIYSWDFYHTIPYCNYRDVYHTLPYLEVMTLTLLICFTFITIVFPEVNPGRKDQPGLGVTLKPCKYSYPDLSLTWPEASYDNP